jgi:SAM-dependent methyltransferase
MSKRADPQQDHWSRTYATRSDFLGADSSVIGRAALERFQAAGVRDLLELGPGQGRDTIEFAAAGLDVTAVDFAETGLAQIADKAARAGVAGSIRPVVGDVRDPLPFADATFDACYAHMLFCMALTTDEIVRLAAEVHRVLRVGGLLVYTVRTTADAHYGAGVGYGDDRWEMGGFVVHFFDRALVERLAEGWELLDVADHEEGKLPRRLFAVTMRRSAAGVEERR